jgi:hypothetical protein
MWDGFVQIKNNIIISITFQTPPVMVVKMGWDKYIGVSYAYKKKMDHI